MENEFFCRVAKEKIPLSLDDSPADATVLRRSESHDHADFELHILLRGSYRVEVSGTGYVVRTGEALLIAPAQTHCSAPLEKEVERFSVAFSLPSGKLSDALRREVVSCRAYPVPEVVGFVCREILRERSTPGDCRREVIENLLNLLLLYNFRVLGILDDSAEALPLTTKRYTDLIDPFFEDHLADPNGIEALAEELHLSRSQVNRVLKKYYSVTFREKLLRARMDRAAWLLRHTDLRADEIAAQVGYTAVPSFYQAFRATMDMTPEQYRKNADKERTL